MKAFFKTLEGRNSQNQYTNAGVLTSALSLILILQDRVYLEGIVTLLCAVVLGAIGYFKSLK